MDNDNRKIYQASDKVKDKILEKREYVKSVLEICNDIIDGKPMSVACREHNIKFDRFRTFIERDWCFEEEIIFNDDYEPTINPTWQDALFAALFGKSNKKAYINKDYQENFDYALSMLSDKEEDIIRKVFIDNLSCREVAEELGSSLGGIQSRFNIALRRLRHPSIAKYLVYGYDLSNEYCKIEEELNQKKEELQNLIEQKKDELAVVNEQIALINNNLSVITTESYDSVYDISKDKTLIFELEFPVKIFKTFQTLGILTIGDLYEFVVDGKLKGLKGFDMRQIRVVVNKLIDKGADTDIRNIYGLVY